MINIQSILYNSVTFDSKHEYLVLLSRERTGVRRQGNRHPFKAGAWNIQDTLSGISLGKCNYKIAIHRSRFDWEKGRENLYKDFL
jgi:hypothetical protein